MFSPRLLAQLRTVAKDLPPTVLESVLSILPTCKGFPCSSSKAQLLQRLPHTRWRQDMTTLLEIWQADAKDLDGRAIATALATAAHCESQFREALSLEVVWTGPDGSGIPVRRTEQVLLQLIQTAQQELILVSFAIYKVPDITQALIAAMNRGVTVTLIAETPTEPNLSVPFGVEAGLGMEVATRAQVLVWDHAKRPKDENGRCGSLHMKCAIGDRHHLFITSANLTGYALSLNMEMGILVHSHSHAEQVVSHLHQLQENRVLIPK